MIPKMPALRLDPRVGTGFRKRSCSNNKIERDDDSKKSHRATASWSRIARGCRGGRLDELTQIENLSGRLTVRGAALRFQRDRKGRVVDRLFVIRGEKRFLREVAGSYHR